MGFKSDDLVRWLATEAPGETLVSYAVAGAGTSTNPGTSVTATSSSGSSRREAFVASLDSERCFGSGYSTTFYALTDRCLILGTRSSIRNRPKDLLYSAPVEHVTVHWFDDDEGAGNKFRHFVTEFGDGVIRSDRAGLTVLGRPTKSNADAFLEALGDRAKPMPPD